MHVGGCDFASNFCINYTFTNNNREQKNQSRLHPKSIFFYEYHQVSTPFPSFPVN